jgi:diguanylate cyclase (GGDEF)-like protein
VVRRASFVFGLTLIVAIAVGFFARRAEIAHERDASLAAASEVGAARLTGIVDAVELAAMAAADPAAAVEAITAAHPQLGVCAIGADAVECGGEGPQPDRDVVEMAQDGRSRQQSADGQRSAGLEADVEVYESIFNVRVDGRTLTLIATSQIDIIDDGSPIAVWAATFLPAGSVPGDFAVDRGIRQTATAADAGSPVYAVAATDDEVDLPAGEQRFYVIVVGLAATLLLLAGATLFGEQRNLLERASFDQLTKLPNRSEFERRATEALANAERQETGVCLLLFDLNGFKQVNDTYGHFAGDELLQVVGSRLRKAVRDYDVVARWGGDEFVVVMPGIASDEMGTKRAQQLADQVAGRTRLEGVSEALRVKVSVGVAIWPRHGLDLAELVEAADQAMYHAKREGITWRVADERVQPIEQRILA